jgi:pimeloyl-ACP methyl ester carboxylesterase
MGGLGCYSIDDLSEEHPYGRILTELTRAGFVTLRVEKTGMGDSEGAECMSTASDLQQEIDGYTAGLKALKTYPFVDSSETFILGHSMGGVTTPIVAGETAVKGIMVSGTIGTSFYEHELDNLRRQLTLRKLPDAQIDSLVRLKALCNHRLYVDRQSLDQFRQELPYCFQLPIQPSVPYTYMQQAFDLNLSKLWAQVVAPVLVVYGTSDFRTTAEENRYIVNVVNRSHPGHATYMEVPEMEHGFGQAGSQQASWNREVSGERIIFHRQFVLKLKRWLCTISPKTCQPER